MGKVLVLLAHPNLERSSRNSRMADIARDMDGVILRDLYELYPRFYIDIDKESRLLKEVKYIIMLHPFYWYSVPALLKQYMDSVFRYGFAYGNETYELKDKIILNAFTTGGSRESYSSGGYNRLKIMDYLEPLRQTAIVCKMDYWPPYVLHQSGRADSWAVFDHIRGFKRLLQMLLDDEISAALIHQKEYMNDWIFPIM